MPSPMPVRCICQCTSRSSCAADLWLSALDCCADWRVLPCLRCLPSMPVAILPVMMIELAVYGLVSGLMMTLIRTRKIYLDLYISLIIAMLTGRIVAGWRGLSSLRGATTGFWVASYFVTSLPGIIIQLVLIPTIVFALMNARLIPRRYPKSA